MLLMMPYLYFNSISTLDFRVIFLSYVNAGTRLILDCDVFDAPNEFISMRLLDTLSN